MPYSNGDPTLSEQIEQHMENKAISEEMAACWDEGYAEGRRVCEAENKRLCEALKALLDDFSNILTDAELLKMALDMAKMGKPLDFTNGGPETVRAARAALEGRERNDSRQSQ